MTEEKKRLCIEVKKLTLFDTLKRIGINSRIIWANSRTARNPSGVAASSALQHPFPEGAKYLQIDPGGLNYYQSKPKNAQIVTEEQFINHCMKYWRK